MRQLEFRMLGPLEVRADDASLDIGGAWARRLLVRLLLDANRVVASDQLVADLLGLNPSTSAINALMAGVSTLRKALGPDAIATGPAGYELRVDWTRTDVHRFERLAAAGRERLAADDPVAAAEMFRLALGLWRGEPLGDFGVEDWALPEVGRLEELRLGTIEDQLDAGLASGSAAVLGVVARLVTHYPRRGRLRGQLIRALSGAGRRDEAIAAFEDARRFFGGEPGVDVAPLRNEIRAMMSYLPLPETRHADASTIPNADTELGFTGSSPLALAKRQPKEQPSDFDFWASHASASLFDDWAFRLGRGEWPDPNDYLDQASDDADELRLLMDTYIRALPRPAPEHEDIERARAWLTAPAAANNSSPSA